MSGIYSENVTESRGLVAPPSDIDRRAVVMGITSGLTGLSTGLLNSGAQAVTVAGYGDAVDTAAHIIDQPGSNGPKFPAAIYGMATTTAGSYGAVDNTGVTGTARWTVDSTVHPYGTYQAQIKCINGGTVGTTGITVQTSLDGGVTWSNTTALGTSDGLTVSGANVKWVATPSSTDLTALNTLINEIFTDLNAHVVLTTGTVHSNADNADVVSAGTYPSATNTATRVARINALRAAYELHRVKGSGGSPAVHINVSGDTTNVITAPVATDDESALVLALDLKAKLNAHDANTTVHTIADATNTVTSPAPLAGTLVVGDVAKVRTVAPQPGASDIDAAFTALAASSLQFGLLVCEFDMTAASAAHISTGLDTLKARGKRVTALVRTRSRDFEGAESDSTWSTLVAADYATFNDSRICPRAGYGLVTDAITSRQYLRPTLQQFAADVVRVERSEMPCSPSDRAESRVSLVDSTGATVGHDEGPRGTTILSDNTQGNRFACEMRLADAEVPEEVFDTVAWVCYASNELIRTLPARRVCTALERDTVSAGRSLLGSDVFYNAADPAVPGSTPTLTAKSRAKIHGVIFNEISPRFSKDIQNAGDGSLDTGLVQVDPSITVDSGNLVTVSVNLAPRIKGVLLSLSITLAVQQ